MLFGCGCADGEVFPSGFAVVAAARALVLERAPTEIGLPTLVGPRLVGGCGLNVGYGRMNELCDERGRRCAAKTGEGPESCGVGERTTRGERVCLGIVLVHGRTVTRSTRSPHGRWTVRDGLPLFGLAPEKAPDSGICAHQRWGRERGLFLCSCVRPRRSCTIAFTQAYLSESPGG